MDTGTNYEVKDLSLANQGKMNIEIAESHMGALLSIKKRFEKEKPLKGIRVGLALHITKETAVLVRTLIAGGAEVAITGCNPLSTQDDVAAALADEKVNLCGGAISLGHPLGMSGCRLAGTLFHQLRSKNVKWAIASLCIGVGQGVATLFEKSIN